ncbi:tyrosine-type recombinase/integrase [Streptomyces sp. 5K101]|uniref:tyrosine-type recombinase/integrase n=1 Tax=Streptomyces sp. 5K101 TaxID=3390037 RepID=UPI003974E6FE
MFLETKDGIPSHVAVWRSVRKHGGTKTKKSRRTIALPKQVVDVREEHMRWQKQECAARGMEWSPTGRVFTTRSGEPLDAANVRCDCKAIVKKAGPKPEWTPRELRHNFVSLLSDHGIPLETIALLVGHSSQTTTEAVYRKQLRPVITEGAEAMDDIFAEDQEGEGEEEGDAVA